MDTIFTAKTNTDIGEQKKFRNQYMRKYQTFVIVNEWRQNILKLNN